MWGKKYGKELGKQNYEEKKNLKKIWGKKWCEKKFGDKLVQMALTKKFDQYYGEQYVLQNLKGKSQVGIRGSIKLGETSYVKEWV